MTHSSFQRIAIHSCGEEVDIVDNAIARNGAVVTYHCPNCGGSGKFTCYYIPPVGQVVYFGEIAQSDIDEIDSSIEDNNATG